mmetsp:Transcript_1906/g.5469  ORF Transcript_1906/g.5469 Transcript_1906/m.5469 type:complete len:225 (-) Transcript_1906:862-1536(-)
MPEKSSNCATWSWLSGKPSGSCGTQKSSSLLLRSSTTSSLRGSRMVDGKWCSPAPAMYSASSRVAFAKSVPGSVGPNGLLLSSSTRSCGTPSKVAGARPFTLHERTSSHVRPERGLRSSGGSAFILLLGSRSTRRNSSPSKTPAGSSWKVLLTRSSSERLERPAKRPSGMELMPLARRLRYVSAVSPPKTASGSVMNEFSRRPRNSSAVVRLKVSAASEVSAKK